MEKTKNFIPLLIVIIIGCITILPLLSNSFFTMHDDTQPTRVFVMAKALLDGQFPVRWVSDLGYGFGYPLYNFYAPLPYYIGAVGIISGLSAITATKLMMILGILISTITMYLLGTKVWGIWGGLVASLLYTFAPYHAVQLYVRGAVAELWAYGFLPLILMGIIYLVEHKLKWGLSIAVFGLSGVMLSHNITGMLSVVFILFFLASISIFWLVTKKSGYIISYTLLVLILGLGISAFFWLPALAESTFTKVEQLTQGTNNFRNHYVYLDQLWNSPWGFAGSAFGRADGMSFIIGKLHIVVLIICLGLFFFRKRNSTYISKYVIICAIGLLVSIFLLLEYSLPVWNLIGVFKYIQYPWRFLVFVVFFASFLSGLMIQQVNINLKKKGILILSIFLIIIPVYYSKFFKPQMLIPADNDYYTSEESIRGNISKISDEYLPKNFVFSETQLAEPFQKVLVGDGIMVDRNEERTHFSSLAVTANKSADVRFNIAYFPGWNLVVDTQIVKPSILNGVMVTNLDSGAHTVTAFFSDTPIRQVANIISTITLAISLYFLTFKKKMET